MKQLNDHKATDFIIHIGTMPRQKKNRSNLKGGLKGGVWATK